MRPCIVDQSLTQVWFTKQHVIIPINCIGHHLFCVNQLMCHNSPSRFQCVKTVSQAYIEKAHNKISFFAQENSQLVKFPQFLKGPYEHCIG